MLPLSLVQYWVGTGPAASRLGQEGPDDDGQDSDQVDAVALSDTDTQIEFRPILTSLLTSWYMKLAAFAGEDTITSRRCSLKTTCCCRVWRNCSWPGLTSAMTSDVILSWGKRERGK